MARKAAYVQEIEQVIETVRTTVDTYGERLQGHGKEYRTRYWLIDPILRVLGWDVSNPGQVWIEYDTGHGVADYAIFARNPEVPVILLEAKSIPEGDIWGDDDDDWDDEYDPEGSFALSRVVIRKHSVISSPYEDFVKNTWKEDDLDDDEDDEIYLGDFTNKAIDQLRRQCRSLNGGYGILSNGSLWSLYDLSIPGNPRSAGGFQKKRVAHFSVLYSPIEECVEHLKKLHRRNLR